LTGQIGSIAWRSLVRTSRQPAYLVPPLVMPLALLAVNAAGLHPATELPGFPTRSFLAFALAVPFVQGALFSTMNAGTELARDVQTGFLNRLALTPLRGAALLGGQLAGVTAATLVQAVAYLVFGLVVGVRFATGAGGIAVTLVLALLIGFGFAAVGAVIALRTGSGEAVQGFFPLLFMFLLLSSMNMPRDLIEQGWFRAIATANPVSYLIEGIRSLVIEGWDWHALGLAFGVAAALAAVALAAAAAALRTRMTRT
jgi:ABC-2 type transport system permease protein